MRSYVPGYELRVPRDFEQCLELMAREPEGWKPFAGGTDLMVLLEQGKLAHKKFISLWRLAEFRGIEVTPDAVLLGALTTYTELQRHLVCQAEFPLLCRAAAETGGIATQNRGTLAGNIANASPAADSPPALLVYDAELELASVRGARWVPYQSFHLGYKKMAMNPDELIRRIRLTRSKSQWRQYYRKVGTRKAQAISKVCFAGAALVQEDTIADIRVALGSVAPTVLRCTKTEALLRGSAPTGHLQDARQCLAQELAPIDDMRSSARYRSRVAQNLLEEFLSSISGITNQ